MDTSKITITTTDKHTEIEVSPELTLSQVLKILFRAIRIIRDDKIIK